MGGRRSPPRRSLPFLPEEGGLADIPEEEEEESTAQAAAPVVIPTPRRSLDVPRVTVDSRTPSTSSQSQEDESSPEVETRKDEEKEKKKILKSEPGPSISPSKALFAPQPDQERAHAESLAVLPGTAGFWLPGSSSSHGRPISEEGQKRRDTQRAISAHRKEERTTREDARHFEEDARRRRAASGAVSPIQNERLQPMEQDDDDDDDFRPIRRPRSVTMTFPKRETRSTMRGTLKRSEEEIESPLAIPRSRPILKRQKRTSRSRSPVDRDEENGDVEKEEKDEDDEKTTSQSTDFSAFKEFRRDDSPPPSGTAV